MAGKSPAVVMVSHFARPGAKKFGGYIKYMDRSTAQRNDSMSEYNIFEYDGYQNYMNDSKKTSHLFNERYDYMPESQLKQSKEYFNEAEKNGSPLWQTVFSFDNQDLISEGLYNPKTGYLNEQAVRESTRVAMTEWVAQTGMGESMAWTAAIHFNTDNIHVHIGLVERFPTRPEMEFKGKTEYRGKVPLSQLNQVKSRFVNQMFDRSPELARLTQLMRQTLVADTIAKGMDKNGVLIHRTTQLMNRLPKDRRQWKYNTNAMKPFHPTLDFISEQLLLQHNPEALKEFDVLLNNQMDHYKQIYGEGTKEFERYKDYKATKYQELYASLGNSTLRELSSLVSSKEWKEANHFTTEDMMARRTKRYSKLAATHSDVKQIQYALRETHQEYLNKVAHDRYQNERDYQRQREQERGF